MGLLSPPSDQLLGRPVARMADAMRFAPPPLAHHLSPCRSQLVPAAFVDPPGNYPGARPKVLLDAVPADVEINLAKVRRAWAGALGSDGYQ